MDGSYYTLSDGEIARLTDWVRRGGVLIGQQGGAEWMSRHGLLYTQFVEDKTFSDAFSTAGLTATKKTAIVTMHNAVSQALFSKWTLIRKTH